MDYFHNKEAALETVYNNSNLPYKPDEDAIKTLLIRCLEIHYGSLEQIVQIESTADKTISRIIDSLRDGGYV